MKYVVYHGSKVPYLKRFDDSFQGSGIVSGLNSRRSYGGFFFSSSFRASEYFADFDGKHPDKAFIVRARIYIDKPFEVDRENMVLGPTHAIREALTSNFENDTEFDGVIVREFCDGDTVSDIFIPFSTEQIEIVGYGK